MAKRRRTGDGEHPTLFEMGEAGPRLLGAGEPHAATEGDARGNAGIAKRPYDVGNLWLGTSSFTAGGWVGTFYPKGLKSNEYLREYAKTFRCVEIDSSFYGTPAAATVQAWYERTPEDFLFALKVPKVITHEKVLKDCDAELAEFTARMKLLGDKLGPLLLQFPWFNSYEFKSSGDFLVRLRGFLQKLPEEWRRRFAVEIRNRGWVDERFLDALREHSVALAWTDTSFVPKPWELKKPLDLITADFAYVRWLGNRKEIETITTTWEREVVDRTGDLTTWAKFLREMVLDKRLRKIFAFANNHYGGFAPGTIREFADLWKQPALSPSHPD
jgi:uncharacterized protein YecE (DUF72 family)